MEGAPLTTLLFQGGSPRGRFAGSPQGAAPARSAPLKQERRGAPSPPTHPPHNHSLLWCCPIGQGGSPNGPPQLTRPSGASGLCCALRACCWDGGYAPQNDKKKGEAPERTSPKYSRVTNGQHHHTEYCHTGELINRCTNLQANHKKNHTNQLHNNYYSKLIVINNVPS